jgi:hypothetical protein
VRDFDELAENYQFTPVRMGAGNLSGYLHLHSTETKAVLSSKEFHHFDDDENGWFDLEIEDHRGSRILLHNALTNSQSMGGVSGGKRTGSYTSDIFPNIVVLGSENLRKDRKVQSLSFTIEGGENFFVYDVLERRSFHAQPDRNKVLEAIRRGAWKPPKGLSKRSDANDPHDIYIIHRPRTYLDVQVADARVRVWHSRAQRGLGWTGHEIRITPVISITFSNPISIDDALDRLWQVKGFFDQLALTDLRVKSVSVSKFKKGWPAADLYLPNEAQRKPKQRLDVHPLHVPFSRWKERRRFGAALGKWLQHSERRRFFRAAIRLSLSRLERGSDPTLLTLLMAGIESLPELSASSGVSKETIKEMAYAAHAVEPSLDVGAIRGLLGPLGRTSPKQRLRRLVDGFFTGNVEGDGEVFLSKSLELRNKIAHGKWMIENERQAAGELARAIVYLCVAYDLRTSGFPSAKDEPEARRLLADSRMSWAWQGYKQWSA